MLRLALAITLCATLCGAEPAFGHSSLIGSEPAERAVVPSVPEAARLTFNEPVAPLPMRLIGPTGATRDLPDVSADGATLVVRLPADLERGTHLLSWRVVSADGHPVGGSLTFSIGAPSEIAPQPDAGGGLRLRVAIWVAKFVLYVGLFVGVGGAFYASFVARARLGRATERIAALALECGVAAALVSVGLQGADALGLPLGSLRDTGTWLTGLATSYGVTALIAAASLGFGCAALAEPRRRRTAVLALTGVGVALAASGHASAAAPQWLTRPAVFVHGVAVAYWVGALLPLAAATYAGKLDELRRFSHSIPAPLGLLIVSGFVLAIVQLRQVDALWTTGYGLLFTAKLVLVAAVLALAAGNRLATPRALSGELGAAQRIGRAARVEMLIAIAVLGIVAGWRFTPPPRSLIDAALAPVHAHIHSDKAMADVKVDRSRDGGRVITVVALDGSFGPLEAKEVTVTLAKPDAGIEPMRLRARHVEATIWRIENVHIPLAGRWTIRVEFLVSDFDKLTIEDEIDLAR